MGSNCSKSTESASAGRQTLGASTSSGGPPRSAQPQADTRLAAAEAAERRLKAAQSRGTNVANPNRGQLAAKLEANKSARMYPDSRREERLVWD